MAARRKPPENMTAFDYLLRGLDHHRLGGVTDDNARQAVDWLTKAITADPHYAAAYASRVCGRHSCRNSTTSKGDGTFTERLSLIPAMLRQTGLWAHSSLAVAALSDFQDSMRAHLKIGPSVPPILSSCHCEARLSAFSR
jgi:adenylate cyclase